MVRTEKSAVYNKCLQLTRDVETYKRLYKKTSLHFWIGEYNHFIKKYIHKSETVKACLSNLPVEIYFKIKSYLYLNDLKD